MPTSLLTSRLFLEGVTDLIMPQPRMKLRVENLIAAPLGLRIITTEAFGLYRTAQLSGPRWWLPPAAGNR